MNLPSLRRRFAVGALVFALPLFALPPAADANTISRDIEDYALFALEKLNLKSGSVQGGHVGVNRVDPKPGDSEATLTFGNKVLMPDDGTHVVGDTIRIDKRANIWQAYGNQVKGTPPIGRSGMGPLGWSAPIVNDVLAAIRFPTVFNDNPLNEVTVPKRGSLDLAPGNYGRVSVQNGATLVLGEGTYDLTQLQTGKHVVIYWTDKTILKIADRVNFGNGGLFQGGMAFIKVGGEIVNFGSGIDNWLGLLHAPYANCGLGRGNHLNGRFVCEQFHSDFNIHINAPVPEPSAIALSLVGALVVGGYVARSRRT